MKKLTTIIILLSLLLLTGCKNKGENTIAIMSAKDSKITLNACKAMMSLNQYINKAIENDLNNAKVGTGNFQIFDYVAEKNIKSNTSFFHSPDHSKIFSFSVKKDDYQTNGELYIFETENNQKIITGNIQQIYNDSTSFISHKLKINRVSYEQSEYNRKSYVVNKTKDKEDSSSYLFDFEIKDNNLSGAVFKNDKVIGFINTYEQRVIIKDNFGKTKGSF